MCCVFALTLSHGVEKEEEEEEGTLGDRVDSVVAVWVVVEGKGYGGGRGKVWGW